MPWPLTRADLTMFEHVGLRETSFEDLLSQEEPFFRHFRIHYREISGSAIGAISQPPRVPSSPHVRTTHEGEDVGIISV